MLTQLTCSGGETLAKSHKSGQKGQQLNGPEQQLLELISLSLKKVSLLFHSPQIQLIFLITDQWYAHYSIRPLPVLFVFFISLSCNLLQTESVECIITVCCSPALYKWMRIAVIAYVKCY